jgi:hypothetical protein
MRLTFKPLIDVCLIAKINLAAPHGQQLDFFAFKPTNEGASDHPWMPRDENRVASQIEPRPTVASRLAIAKSPATISLTNSAKLVLGVQPSVWRALVASPISRSTSVGRK